jgi:hypothetical protein
MKRRREREQLPTPAENANTATLIIGEGALSSLAERLVEMGRLHAERQSVYGDDYRHIGEVLEGMFPRGLTLSGQEQFRRFALFCQVVGKSSRYAQSLARGTHHPDSMNDVTVYSQMIRETDDEASR